MISGKVSPNREAAIELNVSGPTQQPQRTEVVIDTGFNGYLTLPEKRIHDLKLPDVVAGGAVRIDELPGTGRVS